MKITQSDLARFWAKVDKGGECWIWTAALDDNGYGQFRLNGKTPKAHRVSYNIHHGVNPSEDILHSCDNPKCVKPKHLRLGSDSDNMLDSLVRERRQLLYSINDVVEMRQLARAGFTKQQLVDRFGGTRYSVSMAVTGKTYEWVDEPSAEFSVRDKRKSKLTLEQVVEIRRMLEKPYHGLNKKIAKMYGLTDAEVSHIKHNRVYRGVSTE